MTYPWGHARDHAVMALYGYELIFLIFIALLGSYLLHLAAKRFLEYWREKHPKMLIERDAGLLFKRGETYDLMKLSVAKLKTQKVLISLIFELLYLEKNLEASALTDDAMIDEETLHSIEGIAKMAWIDIKGGKMKEGVKLDVIEKLNKLSEESAKND